MWIRGNDKGNKTDVRRASGGDEEENEREKGKKWKRERERESEREEEELLGRIRTIEEEDRAEREREKRRNIVIKGSNEGTVKEFIREKMKVGAGVERTHMIRVGDKNTIIVATMKSMEEKVGVVEVVTTSRKTPHLVFS